jgi:hypothetical protein
MKRRVLPFTKMSGRMVRFDPEECDIALAAYQYRSLFDANIREELARRRAMYGKPLKLEEELESPAM